MNACALVHALIEYGEGGERAAASTIGARLWEDAMPATEREVTVPGLEIKSVKSPDETRPFADKGGAAVVNVSGHPVLYGTFEPGWKWSDHVKPIAGTASCQAPHLLYCLSGRMKIVMGDGSEGEIGPGDVASIDPDHDAWVVGDEPCVAVDFGGIAEYAKPGITEPGITGPETDTHRVGGPL